MSKWSGNLYNLPQNYPINFVDQDENGFPNISSDNKLVLGTVVNAGLSNDPWLDLFSMSYPKEDIKSVRVNFPVIFRC